jgi:hypothetical protein
MAKALGQAAEEACIASLRMRRMPYIAVLTVVTAAMTAGYTAWAGIGVTNLLTTHWPGACSPPRPDPPVRAGDPQLRAVHLLLGPFRGPRYGQVLNEPNGPGFPPRRPTLVPAIRAVGSWPGTSGAAEVEARLRM